MSQATSRREFTAQDGGRAAKTRQAATAEPRSRGRRRALRCIMAQLFRQMACGLWSLGLPVLDPQASQQKEIRMNRKARAVWQGTGKEGTGHLTSDSGVLSSTPYSFKTRFENEKGTNPEELIAAAHAGCFTMALACQSALERDPGSAFNRDPL